MLSSPGAAAGTLQQHLSQPLGPGLSSFLDQVKATLRSRINQATCNNNAAGIHAAHQQLLSTLCNGCMPQTKLIQQRDGEPMQQCMHAPCNESNKPICRFPTPPLTLELPHANHSLRTCTSTTVCTIQAYNMGFHRMPANLTSKYPGELLLCPHATIRYMWGCHTCVTPCIQTTTHIKLPSYEAANCRHNGMSPCRQQGSSRCHTGGSCAAAYHTCCCVVPRHTGGWVVHCCATATDTGSVA